MPTPVLRSAAGPGCCHQGWCPADYGQTFAVEVDPGGGYARYRAGSRSVEISGHHPHRPSPDGLAAVTAAITEAIDEPDPNAIKLPFESSVWDVQGNYIRIILYF